MLKCEVGKMQNCENDELQNGIVVKLGESEIVKMQNCENDESQNGKVVKLGESYIDFL